MIVLSGSGEDLARILGLSKVGAIGLPNPPDNLMQFATIV